MWSQPVSVDGMTSFLDNAPASIPLSPASYVELSHPSSIENDPSVMPRVLLSGTRPRMSSIDRPPPPLVVPGSPCRLAERDTKGSPEEKRGLSIPGEGEVDPPELSFLSLLSSLSSSSGGPSSDRGASDWGGSSHKRIKRLWSSKTPKLKRPLKRLYILIPT